MILDSILVYLQGLLDKEVLLTVREVDKCYWAKFNVLEMKQMFSVVHKTMLACKVVHTVKMLELHVQHVCFILVRTSI